MPIDPSIVGKPLGSLTVPVEAWRLNFFALAIGEQDPVCTDEAAARAAGLPGCPVPPTYFACLGTPLRGQFAIWDHLGIDVRRVLHGEQGFTYHRPAHTGDTLTFTTRVESVDSKKGGALELLRLRTDVHDQRGDLVAEQRATLVVRNDLAPA